MRVLSGIQPSGALHLGNYFGMVKPALDLAREHEAFYFIADYHALTTVAEPEELRRNVRRLALDLLALGLDPERTVFFRQSDVPEVTELSWLLGNVTPMGLLERAHAYKDKLARGLAPSHGLFSYPVLMAADILLYRADLVPVGQDQRQHLEIARAVAAKFNQRFGPVFKLPEARITSGVATIPGVDGLKMSKSYGNTIEVFADEDTLRRRCYAVVTDPLAVDAPKRVEGNTLFALWSLFVTPEEREPVAARFGRGGLGYAELKRNLFEHAWDFFTAARERRAVLERDPARVERLLAAGAARARGEANATLAAARRAVGLS